MAPETICIAITLLLNWLIRNVQMLYLIESQVLAVVVVLKQKLKRQATLA